MQYELDGTPRPPLPPQALRALRRHRDTLSQLTGSFEYATEYAREHLRGRHRDFAYHCHLIRYCVAEDLLRAGWNGTHFRTLANSGLEIMSVGDRLRCWKATSDQEIPPTGDSSGRKQFCNQLTEPLFPPASCGIINPGRLIVLWDLDENFGLDHLYLACPKNLKSIWKPVTAYWILRVPHPADWIEPTQDFRESGDFDFGLDKASSDDSDDEPN